MCYNNLLLKNVKLGDAQLVQKEKSATKMEIDWHTYDCSPIWDDSTTLIGKW